MGIAVAQGGLRQQIVPLPEDAGDGGIGLEHMLPGKQGGFPAETALVIHQVRQGQAIGLARQVVIHAMGRGGVHGAGAGLQGHMLPQDRRRKAVVERVPQRRAFQGRPFDPGQDPVVAHAATGQGRGRQLLRQRQSFRAPGRLALRHDVVKLRVEGDGLVGWQGPRGGGPDDHGQGPFSPVPRHRRPVEKIILIGHGKARIHRRGFPLSVFDLRLRQGRLAIHAPIDWLRPPGQVPGGDHLAQGAGDGGLGLVVHGQVGPLPVTQDPQPLKIGFLLVYLRLRVGAAGAAEGRGVLRPGPAQLFFHLVFYGQTVAIPAWHIGAIQPVQAAGLDDDVLEDLVDGVAQVNVAIGVGRAVVQDVFLPAGPAFPEQPVQILLAPAPQQLRLPLGQIALHGEIRLGQIQGVLVVGHRAALAVIRRCRPWAGRRWRKRPGPL